MFFFVWMVRFLGSTYQCQFGCGISKVVGKKSTYSKEIIVFREYVQVSLSKRAKIVLNCTSKINGLFFILKFKFILKRISI